MRGLRRNAPPEGLEGTQLLVALYTPFNALGAGPPTRFLCSNFMPNESTASVQLPTASLGCAVGYEDTFLTFYVTMALPGLALLFAVLVLIYDSTLGFIDWRKRVTMHEEQKARMRERSCVQGRRPGFA